MFVVLNSYKDDNDTYYAVKDYSTENDIEVITESELKLLVGLNMQLKDQSGNLVSLDNNCLICSVEDITDHMLGVVDEDSDTSVDNFFSYYEDDTDEVDEELSEEFEDSDDIDDFFSAYNEEIIEDEDPDGSVVSKLYEYLNEEQIKVLKRYYLWYSQRLFNDSQKDPTFGLKNKQKIQAKKNILNNLRGDGDWRYAGFLDTGSRNKGYTCTLGHPLRYMHLAWDITVGDIETCFFGENYNLDFESVINSNNCIVYGIKCIGDFFEVSPECIRDLQRAQRESLKDMALLYDFYEKDGVDKAIESFNLLDGIVARISKHDLKGKMMKKDYKPILPFSISSFYTQFRQSGMIPPKSLVQTIRSCMLGWTTGEHYFNNKWTGELKYPMNSLYQDVVPVTLKLLGVDKDLCKSLDARYVRLGYCSSLEDATLHYIYVMFAYECCGVYKYNADTNKDEGGKSKPVKARLEMHYNYNTSRLFEDLEYSLDCLYKLLKLNKMISSFDCSYSSRHYELNIVAKGYDSPLTYFMCRPNESVVIDTLNEFDSVYNCKFSNLVEFFKSLYSALNQVTRRRYNNFTSEFYSSESRQLKLFEVYPIVMEKYSEFCTLYEKFLIFIDDLNIKRIDEYNQKKELERLEREKLEAEKVERLRLQAIAEQEAEKIKQEEQEEKERAIADIDTTKKLIDYLNKNKDKLVGDSWDLPKNILSTVVKSGKEPSDRQLYHLKKMFRQLSGVDFDIDDKVDLSTRKDISDAINYIFDNNNLLIDCCENLKNTTSTPDKFKSILESIMRYGKISTRQMKYAESALFVYSNKKVGD